MDYPAGTVFAGFTLHRVLGSGGMGTVYLAGHPRLPRYVALKLLSLELSADPSFRIRFEQEAELAAQLDHQNIVAVHDRGVSDDRLWIDMQYVDGIDCAEALASQPMPPERALHIITEVGRGLDYAHSCGLLHRDVKPANIMLTQGRHPDDPERVLLTDFGLAKSVGGSRGLTSTGNLIATVAYAAPEQINMDRLDHRTDIYALGAVFFELLTGRVPFPARSQYLTMHAHLNQVRPKVTDLVPTLPAGMDAVVATAMQVDPDRRYQTCREFFLAARQV